MRFLADFGVQIAEWNVVAGLALLRMSSKLDHYKISSIEICVMGFI